MTCRVICFKGDQKERAPDIVQASLPRCCLSQCLLQKSPEILHTLYFAITFAQYFYWHSSGAMVIYTNKTKSRTLNETLYVCRLLLPKVSVITTHIQHAEP